MFYEYIFTLIKVRHAELLASSETARLLKNSRSELMTKAAKLNKHANKTSEETRVLSYTLAHGQEESVLKAPHTDQFLEGAKDEIKEIDDLGEAIFFKKSMF